MHYLTFITCAVILDNVNLYRIVADEKPSDDFNYSPMLSFGDVFDKESVAEDKNNDITDDPLELSQNSIVPTDSSSSILLNKASEQPREERSETRDERTNNGMKNYDTPIDDTEKVATSTGSGPNFETDNDGTSYRENDDDDDDEICHNETIYTSLEYITMVLMKTDIIEQLEESQTDAKERDMDTGIFELTNNQNEGITEDEKQINSDKLSSLLLSALLGSDMQHTTEQEEDLSDVLIHGNENGMNTSDGAANNEGLSETELENKERPDFYDDADNLTKDIGKLLAEGTLLDYQLFASVYIQQVAQCAGATVNATKLLDIPSGIFEAINLVYDDVVNKLS